MSSTTCAAPKIIDILYILDRGMPYGQEDPYLERDVSRRLEQLNLGAPPPHSRGPPSMDGRGQRKSMLMYMANDVNFQISAKS